MVLRPGFFILLSGGLLLAILGSFDPRFLQLVWPYNFAVLGLTFLTYLLAPTGKNIALVRRFDRVLSVRVDNLIRLRVENDSYTPIRFRLREEPPGEFSADRLEFDLYLQPGEQRELKYHVNPNERGDYFFYDSFIRTPGPLGMVFRQSRLPTREIVRVYPNVLALRKFDLLKQRGRLQQIGIRRSRLKGVGSDFDSLREYSTGDDYRKIDWKATARRGKFIVREFEAERNQPVVIVVDYGRLMLAEVEHIEKLDYVLDAALMLGNAAANAHDLIGLMVYADRVERWIPPKKGRAQLGLILETLHALKAEPIAANARDSFGYLATRWKRRSLMVVFTEIEDADSAKDLLTVLGPLARRHICLVVTVADPNLKKQIVSEGPFVRTAGLLFNEDREKAHRLFNQQGVRTLDAEPQELAAALVNYYLDIKASASL